MKAKVLVGAGLMILTGMSGQVLAGTAGVAAQTPEQEAATISQLQEARAEIVRSRELSEHHGVMLSEDVQRQSKLENLIQRLQNGETVNPDDCSNPSTIRLRRPDICSGDQPDSSSRVTSSISGLPGASFGFRLDRERASFACLSAASAQ